MRICGVPTKTAPSLSHPSSVGWRLLLRLLQTRTQDSLFTASSQRVFLLGGAGLQHVSSCPQLLVAEAKSSVTLWRGWGCLPPLLMEWCVKNTGSLVTHAPTCEVDVPHQERQAEGTPGCFSTITHRMFSCYSRSVTEREKFAIIPPHSSGVLVQILPRGRNRP